MKESPTERIIVLITKDPNGSWEKASESQASDETIKEIQSLCKNLNLTITATNGAKISLYRTDIDRLAQVVKHLDYSLKVIPE